MVVRYRVNRALLDLSPEFSMNGITVASALLFTTSFLNGNEPKLRPEPRPVGRPGEPVRGHTLVLTAPRAMQFRQHLDVALTSEQAVNTPPYVRFSWTGRFRTVRFELTTNQGEVVPLRVESL